MKIGIITIHNSTNYGACLQSWGLYKYLVDAGYDCEIIDLHRPVHKDYIYSDRFVDYNGKCSAARKWTLKKFLKRYIELDPNFEELIYKEFGIEMDE